MFQASGPTGVRHCATVKLLLAGWLAGAWVGVVLADIPFLPSANTPSPLDETMFPARGTGIAQKLPVPTMSGDEDWSWQVVPRGLMYPAYLAGQKESRFASQMVYERHQGWLWDVALGGHVGFLRYGTRDVDAPQGWQIDLEGAAFPRLSPIYDRDVWSTDFRFGVPLTCQFGPWEGKFGYKHESSHLGDEFMLRFPGYPRINYVREVLLLGAAYHLWPMVRVYAESGWCFEIDGGAQPWEFQFGAEYAPAEETGPRGAPFAAINGRLRQEVAFGGNLTVEAGWEWRGATGTMFRVGGVYFNGMSEQYQFYGEYEEQIGFGIWYDY